MKKNSFLITLLLITFTPITFGMEPENKNHKPEWLSRAGYFLLYSPAGAASQTVEQGLLQEVDFEYLPIEQQSETILFLTNNNNAPSLEDAADAINSLTKVNHQLATLINAPNFCLRLIKRLGLRFDCSDEVAAQVLPTREAKNRLAVQTQFKNLFTTQYFDVQEFDNLYNQYKDYVDLDFTYRHNHDRYDYKNTLLIESAMYQSPYKGLKIESLLKTNTVNVNYQNARKETALIACAYVCDNPVILQSLCKTPKIQLNLQDELGNTALMAACLSRENKNLQKACIFTLLYAGANSKIANNKGQTPLKINKDVKLLEDAIDKRHYDLIQETIKAHKK